MRHDRDAKACFHQADQGGDVPQLTVPRRPASVVGIQRAGRTLSPAAEAFARLLVEASRKRSRQARNR